MRRSELAREWRCALFASKLAPTGHRLEKRLNPRLRAAENQRVHVVGTFVGVDHFQVDQMTRHAEFVALCEIMSRHHPSILHTTDLYVTVEPCVMCASALRQFGIRSVYFGCLNDRFGGTGGVMTVHMDEGVDPPYPVYGGLFREEAIMLLRRFYVQENDKGESFAVV